MNEYYELGVKLALNYGLAAEELMPFFTREIPETAEEVARRLASREINNTITENLPGHPNAETEDAPGDRPMRPLAGAPLRPPMRRKKMRPIRPIGG